MSSKEWILRKREFSYTFSQSISYNNVVDIKQIYFSSTLLKLWVHISDTVAGVIADPQYYWRGCRYREGEGDLPPLPNNYWDDVFTLKDMLSSEKNKAKDLLYLETLSSLIYFQFLFLDFRLRWGTWNKSRKISFSVVLPAPHQTKWKFQNKKYYSFWVTWPVPKILRNLYLCTFSIN